MQIKGVFKVQKRILTSDKVTGDPYDSIRVKLDKFTITMPRPKFLKDDDDELDFVLQYTSSGTWALYLEGATPELTEAQIRETARLRVLQNRETERNKTAAQRNDEVLEDSDEFKTALADVKKEEAGRKKSNFLDENEVELDEDGNPISDEDA
jgi:hypothetical protein